MDSPIGKFQDENMTTTPNGSGRTSPFAGKKSNGNELCANFQKLTNKNLHQSAIYLTFSNYPIIPAIKCTGQTAQSSQCRI